MKKKKSFSTKGAGSFEKKKSGKVAAAGLGKSAVKSAPKTSGKKGSKTEQGEGPKPAVGSAAMAAGDSGFWMVKQEPEDYAFSQLVKDEITNWTGVRNFQARNFLQQMKVGDSVFYYHSVSEKAVVGLAKVAQAAFPDPTRAEGESWVCVKLSPDYALKKAVTLAEIKAEPKLAGLPLIRQSRLSVMPVSKEMAGVLVKMGGSSAK